MPDLMILLPILIIVIYLFSSIKILAEYERGVIFRLGRVLPQPKGPGVILVFAPIDRIARISLRIEAMEVPSQDVVTRDNVTVKVNAVVYFRVIDPTKAVLEVTNFLYATSQVAQTTLRSALGEVELDELLSQREKLNLRLQSVLDQHTGPWGVKVTVVEVKQVDLPDQMIRAIGKQAEAERERRAKIIHAEGEYMAAEKLAMAAELIQKQPAAIQLRYLQTLVEIGSEKNTTVVFPLPIDIFSSLGRAHRSPERQETGRLKSLAKNEEGEFELILGNRQLISVFLIVVILLGIFFSMGYIVGRNSAPPAVETAREAGRPRCIGPMRTQRKRRLHPPRRNSFRLHRQSPMCQPRQNRKRNVQRLLLPPKQSLPQNQPLFPNQPPAPKKEEKPRV